MGRNLDLHYMIGAPNKMVCPHCNDVFDTYADDYDVDCGDNPNPEPGVWRVSFECNSCESEVLWSRVIPVDEVVCKECNKVKPLGEKTKMCKDCLDYIYSELQR